ncbi:conserved hypothetical protein [Vibrio crassostreae]|nr:conserved hypothetical protein [Vibrio crassostreae]
MIDKINGLANKGIKLWVWAVLVIVAYAVISSFFDSTPSPVKDAKTDLFLGYHESIYETARCDIKEINDSWVILCNPDGQATGGLFEVDAESGLIYALNGKAQTHAARIGINAKVKRNGNVDPHEALEQFKSDING